jgi:hypothetical protein
MAATLDDLERWLSTIAVAMEKTASATDELNKKARDQNPTPADDKSWGNRLVTELRQQLSRMAGGSLNGSHMTIEKSIKAGFDVSANMIGSAVAKAIGFTQSMKQRGFGGTIEQAKFDFAMEQLSKQFAAVFMPVMQAMTYAAGKLERGMRSMGGDGQNRLLGGMLGAGIGYQTMGMRGGLGGFFLGSALMGQGDNSGAGALGGALIGSKFGIPGALIGAGAGYVAGNGDYGRIRAAGGNKFQATFGSLGMAVSDLWQSGYQDKERAKFDSETGVLGRHFAKKDPARRDVTPFSAEMGEAGSTYFRMQQSMIRATAGADFEDAGPLKPIVDIGLKIVEVLLYIAGIRMNLTSADVARTT